MNETIVQKIRSLDEDYFIDLNDWEQDFIMDMRDGTDGLDELHPDDEIGEYLSKAQIKKINEIWENQRL